MDLAGRGIRTLKIEAEALARLPDRLGRDFIQSVELIMACQGRVVVTGIGKSGLVGQKIAATLASVGAPSFFLHSAEGVHGDLGMVTRGDVVIVLSYSGETEEVLRLLPMFARLGTPVIAITGQSESTLATEAATVIDISVEEEACPMNLVPTASTIAAMAMGDALAMAVLEAGGFREEDFAKFHPGGALGRKLLRVGDLMVTGDDIPKVSGEASLSEMTREMTAKGLGLTCVLDSGGMLIGIVTDGDLRRSLEESQGNIQSNAQGMMTSSPDTIAKNEIAAGALKRMEVNSITSLIVMEKGEKEIVGVIHLHHLLRAGVV